jgi:hypothetical protein
MIKGRFEALKVNDFVAGSIRRVVELIERDW